MDKDQPSTSSSHGSGRDRSMSELNNGDDILPYSGSLDSSRTNSPTMPTISRNVNLTIDEKWVVEHEYSQRLSQMEGPSRLVPIAKWIFTILLGSSITVLFVTSKISFIYLSQVLNVTAAAAEQMTNDSRTTSHFLIIFLVIEIPYFLLFLRSAWNGLFTKQNPWPRRSAVLCCLLIGTLEPLGIVILAIKVLPQLSLSLGVLVMSNVVVLSVFVESGKTLLIQHYRPVFKIVMAVSCLFILGGLGVTAYIIYNQTKDSIYMTRDIIHAACCVVCLNIAWLPLLLRQVKEPALKDQAAVEDNRDQNEPSNNNGTVDQSWWKESGVQPDKEASWKASFILNAVRILATFVFSFIFYYVDSHSVLKNFTEDSHRAFISAWDFASNNINGHTWLAFGVNLIGAFVCYVMAFIACHTNVQRGCLVVPFIVSLPLTIVFATDNKLCHAILGTHTICQSDSTPWYLILCATISLTVGQTLALGRHAFRKEKIFLRKEEKYFWIPGHMGAVTDAWLLLNSRHTIKEGRASEKVNSQLRKIRVYICSTMYREDRSEMQQLLESLSKINQKQVQSETVFEAHIVIDGGVKQRKLSEIALTLISLLNDTLRVEPNACTKIITPYGMKLSWALPKPTGETLPQPPPKPGDNKEKMIFSIHLKDNTLVKNKKRWSQIMYMSYVLDFLAKSVNKEEEMYILTTDADVKFTPDSVEALLDLMCRDPTVGAVCARTHPMGSGPLVWYQTFEYAVGHWFQKAAEHVLGSVLCSPGCFSVYRCKALKVNLPKYCKKVESAFDFLTKDMGEDRWLCTLLIQSGWRIEYCAAAENSTNCPSEFEEFYKQRRRWIASTLANLMLIIQEWKYVKLYNHGVSVVFLLYQVLLLFSSLIAPSTVILVVAGGVNFAWGLEAIYAVVLQIILSVLFAMACLWTSSKTQMFIAKLFTFLYAVVMCGVVVGTAQQLVTDISSSPKSFPHNMSLTDVHKISGHISVGIPLSVTSIYIIFLVLVFILAGLLHPKEITCLLHGICFLLCLPSAYLVLMIYSICNLTDSSWGTREVETTSNAVKKKTSWTELYQKVFYSICCCLKTKPKPGYSIDAGTQTTASVFGRPTSALGNITDGSDNVNESGAYMQWDEELCVSGEFQRHDFRQVNGTEGFPIPISVEEWLPPDFRIKYAEIFRNHGFDSTLFIKGCTEADLTRMGIRKRGHVQVLLAEISLLPDFDIEYKVPTDVDEWLTEIGLYEYERKFKKNHIQTPKQMEILKRFDRMAIKKELEITKEGHIKRLMSAIIMLRDPSESQQKVNIMRQVIDEAHPYLLSETNVDEYDFWDVLRKKCLEPDLTAFGIDSEIKVKLVELRNNWLMIMAAANTLWLIVMVTLASKADLTLLNSNPIGLFFLITFGSLFTVQFFAMLVHRFGTLSHYIARAPYTFGKPFQASWSFRDMDHSQVNHDRLDRTTSVSISEHNTSRPQQPRFRKASINADVHSARNTSINADVYSASTEHTPLLGNN